jgi:hypothetical protein
VLLVHCVSLSLVFHCYFHGALSSLSSIHFLFEGIPKISCTQNTTAMDLCSKHCTPTRVWCLHQTAPYPLHCGVIKPSHSFLCTELCLKSLKNVYYWTLILQTARGTASGQQDMFMWEWLLSTPQFSAHKNIALVKTRAYKTVIMSKWSHCLEYSSYLEFLA